MEQTKRQHPVIADFVERCRKAGATIYAGRNFLTATWEGGRRLEVRVDEVEARRVGRNKSS